MKASGPLIHEHSGDEVTAPAARRQMMSHDRQMPIGCYCKYTNMFLNRQKRIKYVYVPLLFLHSDICVGHFPFALVSVS